MSHKREHGDAIDARGSHGFINRPAGSVHQHYHGEVAHDVRGLPNPYLGLAAFTYVERHKYAGRETQISAALAKLTTPGAPQVLLFVTGASGSGKSSFAQAGLLPALEAYYAKRQQTVRWAVMRPSQQPLVQLADAFHQLGLRAAHPDFPLPTWYRLLRTGTPAPQINLLVIDQFEEIFTQSRSDQCAALVSFLTQLPPFARLHTHILVTMRADYLPEVFAYPNLYNAAKAGIDLRVMTVPELHRAIQQPLQHGCATQGKRFETALRDRLATDTAQDATYLPLLQVTLAHLWDRGHLTLSAYGTLTDAIQHRAEDVYIHAADPDTLLAIFLDLVEVSLDDDARRDVRRRRTRADLTQANPTRAALIETLCQARLLSTDIEPRDGMDVEVVDIIHESLLSNWPRLRVAITNTRETLQQRGRFELALRDWEQHQHQEAYLLEGVRLSEAEALDVRGDVAMQDTMAQTLLKRSMTRREHLYRAELRRQQEVTNAKQRRADMFRKALIVVTVLLIVALGATWVALQNATEARRAQALALAIAASMWHNPDEAFVLALAAIRLDKHTPQVQSLTSPIVVDYPLQKAYSAPGSQVINVVFSPDRQMALLTPMESPSELWDVETGEFVRTFEGHTDWVTSVAFSPDGHTIVSGSMDGSLRLWNVATGALLHTLDGHRDHNVKKVDSVIFSPDGTTVLSGSFDRTLRLWDVETGELVRTFEGHTFWVTSVAFSPDGHTIVSGSADETVRLWNVATGQQIHVFEGHETWVSSAVFSADGTTIISGSWDGAIRVSNTAMGNSSHTSIRYSSYKSNAIAFSPDSTTMLLVAPDNTLQLWDIATAKILRTFQPPYYYINGAMVFSPDETTVFLGTSSLDLGTGRINYDGGEWLERRVFSPDGEIMLLISPIITQAPAYILQLQQVATGELLQEITFPQRPLISFSPDGQSILLHSTTKTLGKTLQLWNVETGEVSTLFNQYNEEFSSAVFGPTGKVLSVSTADTVRLWDVETGKNVRIFSGHTSDITKTAISPDGKTVILGSFFGTIQFLDVATGEVLRTEETGNKMVTNILFSPDSRRAISNSVDNTLRLWDVATGENILTLKGHTDTITHIAFSLDGQTVLSASNDDTIRLWDIAPLVDIADKACTDRYIVPEAEAVMREQFAIPDDIVLCPDKES